MTAAVLDSRAAEVDSETENSSMPPWERTGEVSPSLVLCEPDLRDLGRDFLCGAGKGDYLSAFLVMP